MARSASFTALLLFCALTPSLGLKCNEGFNMTLNGIPLYFWSERECREDSKCMGQEIAIGTDLDGSSFQTAMRYGACVSAAYGDYLDCQNLFGEDSNFDPANLLDIIPGIEKGITNAVADFSQDVSASLLQLLSDGTGIEAFVNGAFDFYQNLGLNLTEAVPLKPSLVKMLSASLNATDQDGFDALNAAVLEFFTAFSQLDTGNDEFSADLRTFMANIGVQSDEITPYAALIDKGPGLFRSLFPASWQLNLWYDVAIKLVGDIDPSNWTKTTEDLVGTIKSSYDIPSEISGLVNVFLDAMPDLAKGSQMNPAYVGVWSLELLKKFSQQDNATRAFSTSLINLIETMTNATLPDEIQATIQWIPGLFYEIAPGDKAIVQEVYRRMTDGINSFKDFNSTAPETKLSMMIKTLIYAFGGNAQFEAVPIYNALVVNLSKMFYDLMNVTNVDYTGFIDQFSMVIEEGFKNGPDAVNVGELIPEVIDIFGGTVPMELKPILDNFQSIIESATTGNFTKLNESINSIIASYEDAFPGSPFPELIGRGVNLLLKLIVSPEDAAEVNLQLQYWNVELQFAIIKSTNFSADELFQMATAAWPDFDLYIRTLKSMNPEDVEGLMKAITLWASNGPYTTQGFVDATKPVFMNITKSIEALLGELRQSFTPSLCKFGSCDTDLCNTQSYITESQVFTDMPATSAPAAEETTGSSLTQAVMATTSDGQTPKRYTLTNVAVVMTAMFSMLG